jgi:hypothetical protein
MKKWNANEEASGERGAAVTAVGVGQSVTAACKLASGTAGTGCPTATGGTPVPRL